MKYKFLLLFITGMFALLLGNMHVARAAEKSWYFPSWNVDIAINKDATFVVREEQTFSFTGNFHYVTRTLSHKKLDNITDIRVFDKDTGRELNKNAGEFSISETANDTKITVNFDLTDTTHTWIFQYTVHGGIGYFDDHDELYWNAVSSDRDVVIQKATVTVHLPQPVEKNLLKSTYYTDKGARAHGTVVDGATFSYETDSELPATSNFTIVAGWPRGIVTNPGILKIYSKPQGADIYINNKKTAYQSDAILTVGAQLIAGTQTIELRKSGYLTTTQEITIQPGDIITLNPVLQETLIHKITRIVGMILLVTWYASPLAVLFWLWMQWRKTGRDPKTKTGHTIIAQYEPPDNISPSVMGTLLDERATIQDIIPTIIDLAFKGYIKIIETQEGLVFKKQVFVFEKRKEPDDALRAHERKIMEGIFKHGAARTSQKELENKFYKELPGIYKSLYDEVVTIGYFAKSPDKTRNGYLFVAAGIGFLGFFTVGFFGIGIPLIIDAILIGLFSFAMPARTEKGRLAYEHALGFKEYLHTAERFRLQNLTPELFEKFLSYAMIFHIEKEWAKKFENIGNIKPEWYESTTGGVGFVHGFSAASFANSMSALGTSVAHSATVSPSNSASGGSGFSGGGSAGGGGGGGGSGAG